MNNLLQLLRTPKVPVNLIPSARVELAVEGFRFRLYRLTPKFPATVPLRERFEVESTETGKSLVLTDSDLGENGEDVDYAIFHRAIAHVLKPENRLNSGAWAEALVVATDQVLERFEPRLCEDPTNRTVLICGKCFHCAGWSGETIHVQNMISFMEEAYGKNRATNLNILARPATVSTEPCPTCGNPDPGTRYPARLVINEIA